MPVPRRACPRIVVSLQGRPPGPGCTLSVEFGRDPARALARSKVRKDATNHLGLGFEDNASAALAVFGPGDCVTIAKSSPRPALLDTSPKPAARLVGEVLEEERVHRAFQPNVQLGDFSFRKRHDTNANA